MEDHSKLLEEELKRLDKVGLRVKIKKFEFKKAEIEYLGHKMDETRLPPFPDKVQAIQDAPTPQCVHELKLYRRSHTWDFSGIIISLCPSYRLLFSHSIQHTGRIFNGHGNLKKREPFRS